MQKREKDDTSIPFVMWKKNKIQNDIGRDGA
jgi:hypothetical protein